MDACADFPSSADATCASGRHRFPSRHSAGDHNATTTMVTAQGTNRGLCPTLQSHAIDESLCNNGSSCVSYPQHVQPAPICCTNSFPDSVQKASRRAHMCSYDIAELLRRCREMRGAWTWCSATVETCTGAFMTATLVWTTMCLSQAALPGRPHCGWRMCLLRWHL